MTPDTPRDREREGAELYLARKLYRDIDGVLGLLEDNRGGADDVAAQKIMLRAWLRAWLRQIEQLKTALADRDAALRGLEAKWLEKESNARAWAEANPHDEKFQAVTFREAETIRELRTDLAALIARGGK